MTRLSAHASQYFSKSIAPLTSNNISLVALLPQLTQNFGFSLTLTKDLDDEKTFSMITYGSISIRT
jgi:hypothetical protein